MGLTLGKNGGGGAARVGQRTAEGYSKIKDAARAGLVSTAAGANEPERQPQRVFELHGRKDGMGAAMRIADAIEPFDYQGQEREEPIDRQAVGMVRLNVLPTITVLGVVESLVLEFPAALGQREA